MADARFEDGDDRPLRLRALDAEDIPVISALLQDAVLPSSEMSWMPRRRRLVALFNRFRWEDREHATAEGRPFERVQTILQVDGVLNLRAWGIDPTDRDLVFSLLAIDFEPGTEGGGTLRFTFAGDGKVEAEVECIEMMLKDVSRPYEAPSGKVPRHD